MGALLEVGCGVAGTLLGAALDPVGQHLADASRAAEAADRAAARSRTGEASAGTAGAGAHSPGAASADPPSIPHLLRAGRSPARTGGAAVVTGLLCAGVGARFGSDVLVAPYVVFVATLVALSCTDLTHHLVPRRLLYPGGAVMAVLLVVASAVDHRWMHLTGAAIGGAVAFGLFFAVWWVVPRGMGFGDVRLAGFIGIGTGYLSLVQAYLAFGMGFAAGAVFGVVALVATSSGGRARIPFAPALSTGAVLAVLVGDQLAQSLFHAPT